MRKLISFTLYGDDPKYIEGMYRNLELKEQFYPDWEIIIYHDNSLSPQTTERLASDGALLRNVEGCGILASLWRFLAHDEPDVTRFIVRDSDSRLSQREADAVSDWERSGQLLHIMRDHPHHGYPMLGGMWGMVKLPAQYLARKFVGAEDSITSLCVRYSRPRFVSSDMTQRDNWWMVDMHFLRDIIYTILGNEHHSKIHAAEDYMDKVSWVNEHWSEDFPTPRNENKNFVGEIFDIVDGKEQRAYQYKEL